jgi:hypothetical protein
VAVVCRGGSVCFPPPPRASRRRPAISLASTRRKPLSHKGADVAELVDALDLGNGALFRKAVTSDILKFSRNAAVAFA